MNAAIIFHVHVTTALEWLCAFHAVYAIWYWRIKGGRWGRVAENWLDRIASAAGRAGVPHFMLEWFRPYDSPAGTAQDATLAEHLDRP